MDLQKDSLLAEMLNYSREATELHHRQQRSLNRTSLLACADEPGSRMMHAHACACVCGGGEVVHIKICLPIAFSSRSELAAFF